MRCVQGNRIGNTCMFIIYVKYTLTLNMQLYMKCDAREHGVLRSKQPNGKPKEYMMLQYGKNQLR